MCLFFFLKKEIIIIFILKMSNVRTKYKYTLEKKKKNNKHEVAFLGSN